RTEGARAQEGLDPAEEVRLCRRWRTSQDTAALAQLVEAHLGLVQRIANEFRNTGPEREDLVQEGHLGLVIAARRFDAARSARLATYASYWIRACMMETVVRSHGAVRVGTTRAQRRIFFGLGRARRELEGAGEVAASRCPREREILDAGHLSEESPALAELGERFGISRERVRQLEERALASLRERCSTAAQL